jgi:hypothetical protein
MFGEFICIREWPFPGGLMKQPARLVAAMSLVLGELGEIQANDRERRHEQPEAQAPTHKERRS